jgi:hypothetical protein
MLHVQMYIMILELLKKLFHVSETLKSFQIFITIGLFYFSYFQATDKGRQPIRNIECTHWSSCLVYTRTARIQHD